MDVFNALWDNAEQRKRPADDNFELFSMDEWFALSSTHKILSGSLKSPLPAELERENQSASPGRQYFKKSLAAVGSSNAKKELTCPEKVLVYIPGMAKLPEFDRFSCLSSEEHKDCLRLFLKFHHKNPEDISITERAEYHLFQSLYMRVKEEQKQYLECAMQNWPQYVDRTTRLRGDARNYILQLWKDLVSRSIGLYSECFRKSKCISLHHKKEIIPKLHLIKNLLNIGRIPVVKLPQFEKRFHITTSILKLRHWSLFNIPASQLAGSLHRVPVSRDPNAERMARLNGADIVISSSGLKCLLDNYHQYKHPDPNGVGKSWILPITVKGHRTFEEGKPVTKTIVFIDKKLPPSKMTDFDKVLWYHKHALTSAVVHRYKSGGIKYDIDGLDFLIKKSSEKCTVLEDPREVKESALIKKSSEKCTVLEDPAEVKESDYIEKQDLSSTVTASTCDSMRAIKNACDLQATEQSCPSKIRDDCDSTKSLELNDAEDGDSDTSDQPLTIDLPNEEINLKSDRSDPQVDGSSSSKENVAQPMADYASLTYIHKKQELEPIRLVNGLALPVFCTNLTYNLWSLNPKSADDKSQEDFGKGINLLIRSRIDGSEPGSSGTYEPLCIACKPEFQIEYGPEMVSLSDLTRQWTRLLIHPGCSLARVRVVVGKAEMINVEKKSMTDIEKEAQTLHGENLSNSLSNLYGVLSHLVELPCGEYLLSHSPDMGLSAELLIKTNEEEAYDFNLSTEYKGLPVGINCETPWIPLDTTVILPKNLLFNCMPCTFPSREGPKVNAKKFKSNSQPQKNDKVGQVEQVANTGSKKKKSKKKKPKC